MNRQNIRKMILCLMTVILCVTTCAPAFASTGDRILMRFSAAEQAEQNYIQGVFPMEEGFCIYYQSGSTNQKQILVRYADAKAEPEKFVLQDMWSNDEAVLVDEETATETDIPAANEGAAGEEPAESSIIPEKEEIPAGTEASAGEEPAESSIIPEKEEVPAGDEAKAGEEPAESKTIPENEEVPDGDDVIAGEGFIASEGITEGEDFTAGTEEYIDYSNMSSTYEYVSSMFGWKNDVYALVIRSNYIEDRTEQNCFVKHIRLEDGKAVIEDCDVPELDISSLKEEYDGGSFFGGISYPVAVGDMLVGSYYGNDGNMLVAFDLTTGYCSEFATEEINGIAPGPDGSVLVNRTEYNEAELSSKAVVVRINLEDQSEETILELDGYNTYNMNLCYDQEKDILYYTYDGELWAAPQMDKEQAFSVNECPEAGSGAICLPDGFLLIWTNYTVMIRNTDPAQRSSVTLRVDIGSWNSAAIDAVYAMSEQRGDIAVLLKGIDDEDFDMVQAMMNRDSRIDIYTVYGENTNYNALKNRGFLQDLSDNEEIAADTERMYPYIRDFVKQDGKIVGVPLIVYGSMVGINKRMWEGMGGTEEELPKTWDQFFDWLETLPEKLSDDIRLVETDWMTRDELRESIRNSILSQYETMMDVRGEEEYLFNTPLINNLLKRLEEVDYDALGVKEAEESNEDSFGGYYEEQKDPLLQMYVTGMAGDYYATKYSPMLLTFEEGEEPIIPKSIELAIVNPYSEHPEEAKLFLSLMLKNMEPSEEYTLFADKTEPMANAFYIESMKYYEESLEYIQEALEKAEGDDKTFWETYLREEEEQMERMEEWGWIVSPQSIENYKTTNSMMKIRRHDFMEEILGSADADARKELYQELDREKDVDKFLNTIDNKLQMVRREGH